MLRYWFFLREVRRTHFEYCGDIQDISGTQATFCAVIAIMPQQYVHESFMCVAFFQKVLPASDTKLCNWPFANDKIVHFLLGLVEVFFAFAKLCLYGAEFFSELCQFSRILRQRIHGLP